jgi:hypothetical protein
MRSDAPQHEPTQEQLKEAPRRDAPQTFREITKRVSDTNRMSEAVQSKVRTRTFGEESSRSGITTSRPRVKRFSKEETAEDITLDNERIERDIERQIEEIGRISLDI